MEEQQEFELKDEVWSGASMLYMSEPMRSLVVEVETSSQVQGEVLQAAVDYVGGPHAEGFEDQLVSIRYLSSPLGDQSDSLSLFVTATAGRFDLVFARNFATDVYGKAFLAQLDEHGIPYEPGGERDFMTPRNGLIPALGLASA